MIITGESFCGIWIILSVTYDLEIEISDDHPNIKHI